MSDDNSIKMAKDGVSVVAEVIRAAGDSPQVKEAANNLGQTAVTLTKTINNALLPLAAVNFAFEKAREYFSGKFQQDISEKTQAIPPEHIIEPKASIAGPALQGLAFTHEEPNLKEMYLSLLATSMDGREASFAHPAFVEIIKQLDSEDARLVKDPLRSQDAIPIVQIRRKFKDEVSYVILFRHLINLTDPTTGEQVENLRVPAMVDNWIRLGLVEVTYDTELADAAHYSWVEKRLEFLRMSQAAQPEGTRVEHQKGIMERTELGKRFARAIGL